MKAKKRSGRMWVDPNTNYIPDSYKKPIRFVDGLRYD